MITHKHIDLTYELTMLYNIVVYHGISPCRYNILYSYVIASWCYVAANLNVTPAGVCYILGPAFS